MIWSARASSELTDSRGIPKAALISDGRQAIDDNIDERALRGIAVTRKNFLFLARTRAASGPRSSTSRSRLRGSMESIRKPGSQTSSIGSRAVIASTISMRCCHGTGDASLPEWRHDRRDHRSPAHQPRRHDA